MGRYRRLVKIHEDTILPKEPYDFKLTAMCYASCWDFDGKQAYIPFYTSSGMGCTVASRGEEGVVVSVYAEKADDEFIESGLSVAKHVLGLDEDLREYYKIIEDDPLLGIIPRKYRGLHMRAVTSLWEGVLIGICQQNASFRQGWTMVLNLRRILGEVLQLEKLNVILNTLPTPERILRQAKKLKETKVGYRRDTIVNVAKSFLKAEFEKLEDIKGIGQYTARLARVLALRKYDEFPVDRWFSRLIPYAYESVDREWSRQKVERYAEKLWGKWRGLSAVLITVVTAAEPIQEALQSIREGTIDLMPNKPAPMTLWKYTKP